MSFCQEVKHELCRLEPKKRCCILAESYAPLFCSRSFLVSGQIFTTENKAVADRFAELLVAQTETFVSIHANDRRRKGRMTLYTVCVEDPAQRELLADQFCLLAQEVSPLLVEQDCCVSAFFRGMFLFGGQMTNPEKEYHLELSVPDSWTAEAVLLLGRQVGIELRLGSRRQNPVLYLENREQIEDFLTRIGATYASMQLMEIQIVKEMRARVNRQTNCETANLDKTVSAASAQIQDIRYIRDHGGLSVLPEELRELARLRDENPDLSLRELSELISPKLSRSGVNHRLRRISEFAETLRQNAK